MKEHHLIIPKTARYFQNGELNQSTSEVWIVCHGYGQLANFFLRKFDLLNSNTTCIIAPEGLHRYYLEGSAGRVGASWMTKEDRLTDIKDYINYLDLLAEKVKQAAPKSKLYVLGFSQGCATVSRWVNQGKTQPDALILYAGVFPPDLDFSIEGSALRNTKVILTNGNRDEYLKEGDINHQLSIMEQNGIQPEFIPFEGSHQIYPEVLDLIRKKLS